jgi:DUF4097 and DUF4098 domain-containing protein YvlB
MVSRTLLSAIGITVWTAVLVTAAPRVISHRYGSEHDATLSTTHEQWPAAGCSDLHVEFDGREGVMQSEERTIGKAEAPTLRVEGEHNGGVQVQGSDQADYSVTLCKAARPGSDAESVLAQIKLNFSHGELSVSGPGSRRQWSAHLLIKAPRGAAMDLNVHNGPMGLYAVEGTVKVHAVNGPVTVEKCQGELTVRAENGPISLAENSGKLDVRTQNGPITVNLEGTNWNGAGLEAHATNGPVTLHVPSGYQSGVVLESDGHGPFSCAAAVCNQGRKTWDDNSKRVEFGAGPALVRVSTVNGPVSVN